MKNFYPEYYKKFKCIANKCPDSCCKDWDVVVDDESQSFYEAIDGELGKKLKNVTAFDSDGDRIFTLQDGKCPFWNHNMLCDIYLGLGEEHLCSTCKAFPRIIQDYTVFSEHMLSFACPEASRLMLCMDEYFDYETDISANAEVDYNIELMRFLLKARKISFDIINNKTNSFSKRLKICLDFNVKIQSMLDNNNFNLNEIPNVMSKFDVLDKKDSLFVFDMHGRLDIMSKEWLEKLKSTAEKTNKRQISCDFDNSFTVLARYYIFRYYLNAVDSYDVMCTIKRIICAFVVIGHSLTEDNINTVEHISRTMQIYSKEVEHSYENSEMLENEFLYNPDFSADNLMKIL